MNYDKTTVHYHRRKFDGHFEVIARVEMDGDWRWCAIDVQPTRVKALDSVRVLRGEA